MKLVELAVRQPITVTVGIIVSVLAGIIALTEVPIRMTPVVDSVVIAVTTRWENASALEIESDVIEEQEKKLGDVTGLESMTSISQAGTGEIRMQFQTGTDIEDAMAEVDQKLGEVPSYPEGVDEPEIEGVDPESVDYIAWIGLSSTDPDFDPTTLYDFMEKRIRPRLERIPGVAQVGIRGAREKEVQIRVDPVALAQRGITYSELKQSIELTNDNFSGGKLPEGKNDIRIRAVGRFRDVDFVKKMVIRREESGPIYLRDVADIVETWKEPDGFVRARGHTMPFINMQLAHGGNLLETMERVQNEVEQLNAPGGLLDLQAKKLGLNGTLELVQTYDSTTYVKDALELVRTNIYAGGLLAVITLLLFLRSIRTIGIIAIAIPISTIAAVVVLVAMGRSINIISLAGMAFAVGMVVDNAIVVIENIFRHIEMGKSVRKAAIEGTQEVSGAVLASTLTTLIVFLPVLLIQQTAGQLFRDIGLAIMAAVGVSLIVSITVIPSAAALILKPPKKKKSDPKKVLEGEDRVGGGGILSSMGAWIHSAMRLPSLVGEGIYRASGSWTAQILIIAAFTIVTITGIWLLVPPIDYLPQGNRNVTFGVMIPPPGYNLDQMTDIAKRLEERVRPAWEVAGDQFKIESVVRGGPPPKEDHRIPLPIAPGSDEKVIPPPISQYFIVAAGGRVFHVTVSQDKKRVIDTLPLLNYAAAGEVAPDVINFGFQVPLFRVGGMTGSAVKVDLAGSDLDNVIHSAGSMMGAMVGKFGMGTVSPEPSNFQLPTPELRVFPEDERLRDVGMTRTDVGYAVQANSDGLLLPRQFQIEGELKDLKIITPQALADHPVDALLQTPLATPDGHIVDLASLANVERIREPDRIKHVNRQRAVTLQFTPPRGMPLQDAIDQVNAQVTELRDEGKISPDVEVGLSGSAGALDEIKMALLGDGTFIGTVTSSLFLALLAVYLLMAVLFQSWSYPLVIMVSVPLATFGGFLGLAIVHHWSVFDRYTPVQNMDVLTILGFVILAGVVVNNAILIVHQTLNFLGEGDDNSEYDASMTPREAIAESVRSRVRPIMMSTLTSVGGMLPLVLMPGSGSELYRGLGSVVVGGLLVSTIFTLVLVPIVLSLLFKIREKVRAMRGSLAEDSDADLQTAK
ncbi:MAG: efflux RND transporter permease subunit [Candidatus Omnitrophica bacterium]|nr:efflux RND transporter permease subunit [Candidatus Omnitrophota bacterium]